MDDLISRTAALDALEKIAELFPWRVPGNRDSYDRYNEAWNDAIGRAEIEIEELPSAQRWIPCSERLPDNNRQVLVYARSVHFALAKYDEMREADGTYKMQWVTFDAWKPFYTVKEVIAWMPLPEPYKEEQP